MPHQLIETAVYLLRAGGIAEHVRSPLLFGHSHADKQAALLAAGEKVRIVAVAHQRRQPVGKRRRHQCLQQRRSRRGHGHRAQRSRLYLRVQHKARRAGNKSAGKGLRLPRQIMHPVSAQPLHQQVPGRMKAHVVQPRSAGIVAQQLGRVDVGEPPELQRLCGSQLLADACQQIGIPTRALALHGFAQCGIGKEKITVAERHRLVEDGVGLPGHGVSPL